MKLLLILAFSISISGCGTTIYRNGVPVMRTYGDSEEIAITDGKVEFVAKKLNHPNSLIEFIKMIRSTINASLVGAASGGIL